ncbi:MAG: glucokinase [Gemmatimonadota bacterium]
MLVLAGDVGGTNTRLALAEVAGAKIRIQELKVYPSRSRSSLEEITEAFVPEGRRSFEMACFGVAGPVWKGRAHLSNLPWVVDERRLSEILGVPTEVMNDLEAMAWGVSLLAPDELALLQEGEEQPEGNAALIAPGTGLGEAGLFWDGREHRPFSSEGGHTDFAPSDKVEREFLVELSGRFGHVSWERVVSGPGLAALHQFLCRRGGTATEGCPLETIGGEDTGPEAITRAAKEDRCQTCVETMKRFCRLLGAEAGNLALTVMATGGVWIGGGIAPDILHLLREGPFLEGFTAKGRLRKLMERIPVRVILDEHVALRGAARRAFRRRGVL